ncbi:MAG TPA: terminase small subunit [Sedimentisphaerales bacterium]|nr:terminase small subunit [Sedimentisphaerales bacterium]
MAEDKQRKAFMKENKIKVNPTGPLNSKQHDFCLYYVELGNGVAAYRAAYGSQAVAGSLYPRVAKLMAMPKVRDKIQALREKMADLAVMPSVQVLKEVRDIALLDPRGVCGDNGTILDLAKMPQHIAAAVASIEVEEIFEGPARCKKLVGYTKKVKFWNKVDALDKAMKHLGLFEADNKQRQSLLDKLPYEQVKQIEAKLSEIVRRNMGMAGESGPSKPSRTTH